MGATLRISDESIQGENAVWMPRVEIFDQVLELIASTLTNDSLVQHFAAPIDQRPYLTLVELNTTQFQQIEAAVSQLFESLVYTVFSGSPLITPAFLRSLSEFKALLRADTRITIDETQPGSVQVNTQLMWNAPGYIYDFTMEQCGLLALEADEERLARYLIESRMEGTAACDLSAFSQQRFCTTLQQIRYLQQNYGEGHSLSAHAPAFFPDFGRKVVSLYYLLLDDPRRKKCQFITVIK